MDADLWPVITLSLRVAIWAVVASLPFAVAIAWVLSRRRFPGHGLLDLAVHLPLVVPPVVTGYVLLILFGTQGPLGRLLEATFGVSVAFRWTGAALAAAIMAFPLIVRAIRLGFDAVDPGLEEAASTLGAPPWRVFATVTLPLAIPGILAGTILGFAKALGEFGATITFVSNIPGQTRTIPTAIYAFLQTPGGEAQALRLIAVSVVISAVALVASEVLARRMKRRLRGGS